MNSFYRILYVEDDLLSYGLIKAHMERFEGIHLIWADNPAEVDSLRDLHFDLILCDGQITGWPNHLDAMWTLFPDVHKLIYSAANEETMFRFVTKYGRADAAPIVFSKTPQGTHYLVQTIAALSRSKLVKEAKLS